MENKFIVQLEKLLTNEINSTAEKITPQKTGLLIKIMLEEAQKAFEDPEFLDTSEQTKEYIVKHIAKWSVLEAVKLFQTEIPEEYYNFAFELIIESIVTVVLTCLEAEFDKGEIISTVKTEAHIGLLLAINILNDEEKIDDLVYLNTINIVGDL